MTCWLKFDSDRFGIDSSCIRHVKIHGKPQKPTNDGWGYIQPVKRSNTIPEIIRQRNLKISKKTPRTMGETAGHDDEESKNSKP
jgi:hypothetical protein